MKAVIFDVDGTLLNTERIFMAAWKKAGKAFGYDIPEEALLRTRARSREDAMGIFQACCGEDFPYDKIMARRVEIAEQEISARGEDLRMPGVQAALRALRDRRIPLAVASSTALEKTIAHLERGNILSYFHVVVGGNMVKRGKPNPDIFLEAAKMLGIPPADCVVIEDSPAGIQAAAAAGMCPILIPDCVQPDAAVKALCRCVLKKIDELSPLLDDLFGGTPCSKN